MHVAREIKQTLGGAFFLIHPVVNVFIKTNSAGHGLVWVLGFCWLFQTFQVGVCRCKKGSWSIKSMVRIGLFSIVWFPLDYERQIFMLY